MAKILFSKPVGGDGAVASLSTDDSGNLVVAVSYPIAKLEGPVDQVIDKGFTAIEGALGNPGWLKALADPADAALKAEIAVLIGG